VKGLSAVADERCRTDKLDGVIKHRLSRETTMVGRGASLDGCLFLGGADGSNPVPSVSESVPIRVWNRRIQRSLAKHRSRPRIEPSCRMVDLYARLSTKPKEWARRADDSSAKACQLP
jgi:hypothetical protein